MLTPRWPPRSSRRHPGNLEVRSEAGPEEGRAADRHRPPGQQRELRHARRCGGGSWATAWRSRSGGEWVNYRLKLKGKNLTLSGGDLNEPVNFQRVGPPSPRPDSIPVPPDPGESVVGRTGGGGRRAGGRRGGQAGRRAGGQAGRRAGGQAGRRAGGQASKYACHPERSEGPCRIPGPFDRPGWSKVPRCARDDSALPPVRRPSAIRPSARPPRRLKAPA